MTPERAASGVRSWHKGLAYVAAFRSPRLCGMRGWDSAFRQRDWGTARRQPGKYRTSGASVCGGGAAAAAERPAEPVREERSVGLRRARAVVGRERLFALAVSGRRTLPVGATRALRREGGRKHRDRQWRADRTSCKGREHRRHGLSERISGRAFTCSARRRKPSEEVTTPR